jgi:hypothetical protein
MILVVEDDVLVRMPIAASPFRPGVLAIADEVIE